MPNPRTKEGREELRQFCLKTDAEHGLKSDNDFLTALDGLDIAEEMADAIVLLQSTSTISSGGEAGKALRRWRDWQAMTPAEEEP